MSQSRTSQIPAPPAIPAPPGAPAAPAVPGVTIVTPEVLSARDVGALRARASELSNQLNSATGRRSEVQRQLGRATGADRSGLELRLGVLDARIARIESDIDQNGIQLASLAAKRGEVSAPPSFPGGNNFRNRNLDGMIPIAIVFTLFVLAPIAVSISRIFWKRGTMPRHAQPAADHTQRLERMEQAIDSIAIEIERVSEGQRFVTRLMSERQEAALGAGQQAARPIAVAPGERIASR